MWSSCSTPTSHGRHRQYRQVFLQRGSRAKMLTDGEVFPIRLGACCTPGSVSPLHPGADWLPTPKAGRDPPVCGRSWIYPWIGTIACWRWVAQPCGAAPVRSHGSNEWFSAHQTKAEAELMSPNDLCGMRGQSARQTVK